MPFDLYEYAPGARIKMQVQDFASQFLLPHVEFLSSTTLVFREPSSVSAEISIAQIKSATFLRALARNVSFYLAKENLNSPFF